MAPKKLTQATQSRASSLGYPSPPTGQGKQTGNQAYPTPQTSGWDLGLNSTSHNGSAYPQPNSANQPDTSSSASPGNAVPGAAAYRPSLAGNAPAASVENPGLLHGDEPPDYP